MRRKADGTPDIGATWESLVERQIREAVERGDFDDLPQYGRRLPVQDEPDSPDEQALARIVLRNAGAVPTWIAIDGEIRDLIAARDALMARAVAHSRNATLSTPPRDPERAPPPAIGHPANPLNGPLDPPARGARFVRAAPPARGGGYVGREGGGGEPPRGGAPRGGGGGPIPRPLPADPADIGVFETDRFADRVPDPLAEAECRCRNAAT